MVHSELDALTHSAPVINATFISTYTAPKWRWLNASGAEVFLNGESQGFLVFGEPRLPVQRLGFGTYVQLLWTSGDYDDEISFDAWKRDVDRGLWR